METAKNRSQKGEADLCPIGLSRLEKVNGISIMLEEYKQIAGTISLFDKNENKILSSSSPTFSPKDLRKSKVIKNLKKMDKIQALINLLELLAKMEVVVGQGGLDASLDINAELRKIYIWLSDKNNFTDEDKNELKKRISEKKDKSKKTGDATKLQILQNLIDKKYTPELLRYSAQAIYAASVTTVESGFHPGTLAKATKEFSEKIEQKKEKTDSEDEKLACATLKTKLEALNQFLSISNFTSPNANLASYVKQDRYAQLSSSIFANTNEEFKLKMAEGQEKMKGRVEEQRYANFRKYEKALQLAISILKDPMFADNEKGKEDICKIIALYQSEMDYLLDQSEKLQAKLIDENKVYNLANEVASKIDFVKLSVAFASGNRKQETSMIREMLGAEFQVDAHGENGEGNNALYIIYKKHKEDGKKELKTSDEVKEIDLQSKKLKEEETKSSVSNSNSESHAKKSKPQPNGVAVVIRAQNMNEHDLQAMISPKHLVQRMSCALDFSEPGFTKQYALMPGVCGEVFTGEDKVYRNYEISEAVFGDDLGKIFKALHANIAGGQMSKEEGAKLLQISFINYAKQLIQLFMECKRKGICYTDLKPSNVLTSAKIKISDDKTAVNVLQLKDGQLFYPRENQPLQLTGGFYTPLSLQKDSQNTKCYNMDQLSRDTLAITLFQLMSGVDMEDASHGHDFDKGKQGKMLSDFINTNPPIFAGELGEEIKTFYKKLIAFMLFKKGSFEELLTDLESLEKTNDKTEEKRVEIHH